jgi:hypothetical protein
VPFAFSRLGVLAGVLAVQADTALGAPAATLTLDGGSLRTSGAALLALSPQRTVATGAAGGTLSVAAGTTLQLTGPLSREIRVAVDGRAALVEDFGVAEPTTVVTLDGLQFTRLAGGRGPVSYRPADVEYAGDAVVGKRIVENLAYVI